MHICGKIQSKYSILLCVEGNMAELSIVSSGLTAVKVSSRHQISLPSAARRQLGIEAGDKLLVDVQDGILILMPQPRDFVEHMAGLHQDIWTDLNTDQYLEEERTAWTSLSPG
jgi:AbrB family looped-hinge helix DNA binding protein